MNRIFALMDRLPDFAFALVILVASLSPIAVLGVIIFSIAGV